MIKIITNTWDWGTAPLTIVKPSPTMLVKSAGWYRIYKEDPDNTYVNAIFLGADEYYSSNNNGDAFKEDDLVECHPTFVSDANHFKHHDNGDPDNSYGKVCESFYNQDMHRVEGIIQVINKRSPDMVDRINRGIMVPLSMACRVKFDTCLLPDTKVLTENGPKYIADIEVGTKVRTHLGKLRKVTRTFKNRVKGYTEVHTSSSHSLKITLNHPVWSTRVRGGEFKWTPISGIHKGDFLWLDKGKSEGPTKVESIIENDKTTTVYNLSVEEDESYIANNIVDSPKRIIHKRQQNKDCIYH